VLELNLFLEPSTTFPFDDLHGVGDAVPGGAEQNQMDVVYLDIQLEDFPMFPLADGFKDSF